MTRGRASTLTACLGAAWLAASFPAGAFAREPARTEPGARTEPASEWVARRHERDAARRSSRTARWSGTLESIVGAFTREARAESTYITALESWALGAGSTTPAPRSGSPLHLHLRRGALDLVERGRRLAAFRILEGPLRADPLLHPLRARLVGLLVSPDSGLALLDWPPDRRLTRELPIRWDAQGRPEGDEGGATSIIAAELSDSLRSPRARRAALWPLLRHRRPAVRSWARIRLARSLVKHGEPGLARAILGSSMGIGDEEAVLLANLKADLAAALGDSLGAAAQLIEATRGPEITTAARYAIAMRAADWLSGARADSVPEAAWMDLVRTLGNVGEADVALSLFRRRRTPAPDAESALARAETEAMLLQRLRRHSEAAAAYAKLLDRADPPRDARARYALALARSLRALGNFAAMDSAFVQAAVLDSTGLTASQAAWERAREWEDRKSPRESAPIFDWARRYVREGSTRQTLLAHAAIAWIRAGQPDSALPYLNEPAEGALFWRARAQLSRGDTASARLSLHGVPLGEPWSYEGVRAREELRLRGFLPDPLPPMDRARGATRSAAEAEPPLAARLFGAAGAIDLKVDALRECAGQESAPESRACTDALEELGVFRVGRSGDLPWDRLEYPPAYPAEVLAAAGRESLSAALLWAIMRQESAYQRAARSRAGALGLLQLLPSTASRLNGSPVTEASLTEPDRNVRLGARYLAGLFREFGDPRAAMAAYNAGEDAVRRWLRERPVVDDVWVELIPYRETRDYVKQVYSIWRRYETLYGVPSPVDAARGPGG